MFVMKLLVGNDVPTLSPRIDKRDYNGIEKISGKRKTHEKKRKTEKKRENVNSRFFAVSINMLTKTAFSP